MKKMRAFGTVLAMILSSGVTPVFAVSTGFADGDVAETSGDFGTLGTLGAEVSEVSDVDARGADTADNDALALTLAQAEQALMATVNVTEVAGVRTYLQGLITQAQNLDFAKLSTTEQKELLAALNEGARGLRMLAGVDRKESSVSASDNMTMSTVGSGVATSGVLTSSVVMSVTNVAVAQAVDAPVAGDVASSVEMSGSSGAELATLALAQVKKTSGATLAVAELDGVEVPKTGASDEAEQTSNAVRGMGLVLGGAVVLAAAAGAVLIVKRMKRGL